MIRKTDTSLPQTLLSTRPFDLLRRKVGASFLVGSVAVTGCAVDSGVTNGTADHAVESGAASSLPTSCLEQRDRDAASADGDYALAIAGTPVTVYCHDMAGQPKEFLPLPQTGESNVATYGAGDNSPGGLRSAYTKVRLDLAALAIDPDDATFATSEGYKWYGPDWFFVQGFGIAGDCVRDGSTSGRANIDLRGTPFAVVNGQFEPKGWNPAGTAEYSADDQVVNLTGGGYCGDNAPTSGKIQLRVREATSCRDLRAQQPAAADGEYVLALRPGFPTSIYCHDMAGEPKEFLTLPQNEETAGPGYNFSSYGAGDNTTLGGVTTSYTKVRLRIDPLAIDTSDETFAIEDGGIFWEGPARDSLPYGVAADCVRDGSESGRANIDLTGTRFAVQPHQFEITGFNPGGDIFYKQPQVVDLRGGGYCGKAAAINGFIDIAYLY